MRSLPKDAAADSEEAAVAEDAALLDDQASDSLVEDWPDTTRVCCKLLEASSANAGDRLY